MSVSVEEAPAAVVGAAPEPGVRVVLRVTGASARVGPATWGQLHMLRHFATAGANSHLFSYGGALPVPDGCDLRRALNAVAEILGRYETLRTTYQPDGARQIVSGAGELTVGLYEAPAERAQEIADQVVARLTSEAFAIDAGWPVRFAAVLSGGRPVMLAFAFSHLALDAGGADVVAAELSRLLAGGEPAPPPRWQPVDQAGFERSPDGQALNRQAIEYLRHALRTAPASVFDFPVHPMVADRAVVLELRSPAAAAASARLAARLEVSDSSVLLAAIAVLLGRYTGHTATVLHLVAANRTNEPQRSLVANVALDTVCVVDLAGLSFRETVRRAFEASVSGYLNSQCDPNLRWATIGQQQVELGRHICLSGAFNDGRSAQDRPSARSPEDLLDQTRVISHRYPFGGGRFYVHAGGSDAFTFVGDAVYVPHEIMLRIAYGFERLLVTAASRDIPAEELPAVAGVRPVRRGPEWVQCRDGYVDLGATRELWRKVAGTGTADVYAVAPQGSLHRLVGYVYAPDDARRVAQLHRDFTAALDESTSVRAPDWYVRCAQAPVSHTDRESWSGLDVAEEGRGR